MSNIPLSRYVSILSGVAGAAALGRRELIGRLFTSNSLVPPQVPLEYTKDQLDEIADQFGSTSEEYLRAVFYFGWVSPLITSPRKISFARYTPSAVAAQVHGNTDSKTLATYTAIDDGSLNVSIDGYDAEFTGIDLSSEVSIDAVCTAIETLINGETYGGTQFTSATVTYSALTNRITLTSGETGAAEISVSGDVAEALGWVTGATVCYGADAQTPVECFTESVSQSDNFGSFLFMPALTNDQILAVAQYNAALNVMFQYCVGVTTSNAGTISALVDAVAGIGLTLLNSDYAEMCQMMVLAATDYTRPNGIMQAMFKQFDLTASVTSSTGANTYDALRVNYIGRTQSAGSTVSFYQRGFLMGGSTDPKDMNTYANEQWLKDACKIEIINLLLATGQISANSTGRAQVMNAVQTIVEEALDNGVISVEKELTNTQKDSITTISDDPDAWRQVQNIGYWLTAKVTSKTVSGSTEYTVKYTLIYAKADAIREVEGTHVLI